MIGDEDTQTQAHSPAPQPPPAPPPKRSRPKAIARSVAAGLLLWAGEAVIGMLPLGAVEIVTRFTGVAAPKPIAEACILGVVISGLSLLSLLRFGPHQRAHRMTPVSYFLALVSVLTLMAGGLMYGLAATDNAHGATGLAYLNLWFSLASSLALALETAILDA